MRKLAVLLLTAMLILTGTIIINGGAEAVGATGSPGTPVGVGGVGYIDVSWSPAPGTPSQYYVYWGTVNGTVQVSGFPTVVGGTTSHVTMGGAPDYPSPLPPGYTLFFQVCADYGPSGYTYSGWSAPVTAVNYPGVPGSLKAGVQDGSVALSWSAPASNGGAAISSYDVYRGSTAGALSKLASVPGTEVAYLDDSAAGGQTYFYAVAAFNGYNGALSQEVSVPLPPGRPGVVTGLSCVPGLDNITLTWSAPSSNGGSTITDYMIYRSTVSGEEALIGSTGGANLSYVDRGVVVGETYYYQVAAVNAVAESGRGSEVQITYAAPPSSPRNLQAGLAPGEVRLTWDKPASDGGSSIIWYDIYRNNLTAGSDWEYYGYTDAVPYFNDTGVQLGCVYQYRVLAWNEDYVEGPLTDPVEIGYTLPSAPLNIAASMADKGSLEVSWDDPGSSSITAYVVYWGTSSGTYSWNATHPIGSIAPKDGRLSVLLTGLEDDTVYYVTVAAVNALGTGTTGAPASVRTVAVPGPVTDLNASNNGKGKIHLVWGPPADASSVMKYTVYRGTSPEGMTFLSDLTTDTPYYYDSGLQDGVTYYYKVTATSDIGEGAAATVTGRCGFPPGAPQDLIAVGGLGNITLSWEPPSYVGGGITKYLVCRCATLDGSYVLLAEVDGANTRYVDMVGQNETWFYKVYAASPMGTSVFSNAASSSSFAPPSAPVMVRAGAGDGTVHLVWQAPGFEGYPSISGYRVYRGTSASELSLLHDVGLSLEYNDTLLINGAVYYYAVLAYNDAYVGPLSTAMAGSAGTPPSAPSLGPVKVGDSYVDLSWTPSADDGGRPITAYEVYQVEGSPLNWSTLIKLTSTSASQYNDTSAVNGYSYTYYVVAVNELGSSEESDMRTCIPSRAPGAPSGLEVEGGHEAIYLNWSAPTDMGGGVLHYLIYRGVYPGEMVLVATVGDMRSYTDGDVLIGVDYYYRIAASNWAGEGAMCSEVSNLTIYQPSQPWRLVATPYAGGVHLSWEWPLDDGNAPLSYRVYRSISGGEEVLIATTGAANSFNDNDIVAGVVYQYRVTANNSFYEGKSSGQVSASPYGVPSAPSGVTITSGNAWTNITWAAPSSDATITGYSIYRGTGPEAMVLLGTVGAVTFYNDTGVENGLTYYYAVAAISEVGEGNRSEAVSAGPSTVPGAPADLTAASGIGYVSLTWSSPGSTGGAEITGYNIYRGTSAGSMTWLAVVFSGGYNDTDAMSGERYLYRIVAVNADGEGSFAEVEATALFPPPAPTSLAVERTGAGAVITWEMPELNSTTAPVTGFAIYRQSVGGELVLVAVVSGEARSFTDAEAPQGAAVYSVAALHGDVAAGVASISQSAELSAKSGLDGTALVIMAVMVVGGLLIVLLFYRRRSE